MANITVKNIPADLYEHLKESAGANHRSINGEIIACIERAVGSRKIDVEAVLAEGSPVAREVEGTTDHRCGVDRGQERRTSMIVVDTNVISYFYLSGERSEQAQRALRKDPHWVAPWLWRSEFRNVLILYVRSRQLTLDGGARNHGQVAASDVRPGT